MKRLKTQLAALKRTTESRRKTLALSTLGLVAVCTVGAGIASVQDKSLQDRQEGSFIS